LINFAGINAIAMFNSVFLFLNLGGGEVFIIVLVIILLFGSDKLPGLAKGIGKGIREINDAKSQIQNEIQKSTSGLKEEIEKHTSDMQSEINKASNTIQRQANNFSKAITEESKPASDNTGA
jgi:sec-independent protein translocase protein TatA